MATTEQIMKLRRRLQDLYDDNGDQLLTKNQAFKDDELADLIDDAFSEVSDGARTSATPLDVDVPLAMLIARADGVLMLAQDESRRTKWIVNNKEIDATDSAKRLLDVAKELRQRYKEHRDRILKKEIDAKIERPTGGQMVMNTTVTPNSNRNFNNRDVARNRPYSGRR